MTLSQPFVRLGLVAALLTFAAALPAHAQFTQSGNAYYTTADHTLNTNISGNDVFVGKDPGTFATLPGTVTLTVETGANVTGFGFGSVYSDGNYYYSLTVLGNHRANITGGNVSEVYGYNTSTTNISGGTVGFATGLGASTINITGGSVGTAISMESSTVNISVGSFNSGSAYNASTMNISGGSFDSIENRDVSTINFSGGNAAFSFGYETSTTNISGGNITKAYGAANSTTNISGSTLTDGFLLYDPTATVNFLGTEMSFAYQSYGNNNPYNMFTPTYADFFKVSGIFSGEARTYDLYIRNLAGASGTSNPTQRQFNLIIVPEASTFALALPALAMVGTVVIAKRRKK